MPLNKLLFTTKSTTTPIPQLVTHRGPMPPSHEYQSTEKPGFDITDNVKCEYCILIEYATSEDTVFGPEFPELLS